MAGTLYLVPNLLGPLDLPEEESSLSIVLPDPVQQIAARLPYFVAENAKTARAFLKCVATRHPLGRPLQEIQIRELNVRTPEAHVASLLEPILQGEDGGLISEAGVPAVADPGANLVRLAHRSGITVKPLVGPSSLLLAVMASGLNGQSFAFHGYLPVDAGERAKRIRVLEDRSRAERQTQIFIETPYRNRALLEALANVCRSDTLVSVATDLTLATESIQTRPAAEWKSTLAGVTGADLQKRPTVFLLLAG